MSLLTTLLSTSGGGGSGTVQDVILLSALVGSVGTSLTVTQAGAGAGATLTNAGAQAAFAIDGVTPAVGSRILIKDQSTASQNGVYTLTVAGDGTHNWVLTRATDFNQPSQIAVGVEIVIASGTVNAGTEWVQTATVNTVDTDSITFIALASVGYTASRAVVTNAAGKIAVSAVTSTELGYSSGVTSAIQTQINNITPGIPYADKTTTPVTLTANNGYMADSGSLVTFNMPTTVAFGSIFVIKGFGSGGWLVQMNTGQVCNLGSSPTTSAGSLASANRYDCVTIFCAVANTTFVATADQGNITVA